MKNEDVVKAFINKLKAKADKCNMSSDGITLYSYETAIAEWIEDDVMIINPTRYSNTTSKHQSILKHNITNKPIDFAIAVIDWTKIPIGTKRLNKYFKE